MIKWWLKIGKKKIYLSAIRWEKTRCLPISEMWDLQNLLKIEILTDVELGNVDN